MSGRIAALPGKEVITNGNMASQIISSAIPIKFMNHVWAQFEYTGSPAGSFFLDGSDNGTSWVLGIASLALSSSPAAIDAAPISAHYVRLRWEPSGGTGTLVSARISGKQI